MSRALIVEDDRDMREGLALILDAEGIEARTAADGARGLALLSDGWRPDFILLDLMMPVMSGAQFRQAQLADPAVADIPVVVVSGRHDLTDSAGTLRAAAVLQKPFSMRDLLAAIEPLVSPARRDGQGAGSRLAGD